MTFMSSILGKKQSTLKDTAHSNKNEKEEKDRKSLEKFFPTGFNSSDIRAGSHCSRITKRLSTQQEDFLSWDSGPTLYLSSGSSGEWKFQSDWCSLLSTQLKYSFPMAYDNLMELLADLDKDSGDWPERISEKKLRANIEDDYRVWLGDNELSFVENFNRASLKLQTGISDLRSADPEYLLTEYRKICTFKVLRIFAGRYSSHPLCLSPISSELSEQWGDVVPAIQSKKMIAYFQEQVKQQIEQRSKIRGEAAERDHYDHQAMIQSPIQAFLYVRALDEAYESTHIARLYSILLDFKVEAWELKCLVDEQDPYLYLCLEELYHYGSQYSDDKSLLTLIDQALKKSPPFAELLSTYFERKGHEELRIDREKAWAKLDGDERIVKDYSYLSCLRDCEVVWIKAMVTRALTAMESRQERLCERLLIQLERKEKIPAVHLAAPVVVLYSAALRLKANPMSLKTTEGPLLASKLRGVSVMDWEWRSPSALLNSQPWLVWHGYRLLQVVQYGRKSSSSGLSGRIKGAFVSSRPTSSSSSNSPRDLSATSSNPSTCCLSDSRSFKDLSWDSSSLSSCSSFRDLSSTSTSPRLSGSFTPRDFSFDSTSPRNSSVISISPRERKEKGRSQSELVPAQVMREFEAIVREAEGLDKELCDLAMGLRQETSCVLEIDRLMTRLSSVRRLRLYFSQLDSSSIEKLMEFCNSPSLLVTILYVQLFPDEPKGKKEEFEKAALRDPVETFSVLTSGFKRVLNYHKSAGEGSLLATWQTFSLFRELLNREEGAADCLFDCLWKLRQKRREYYKQVEEKAQGKGEKARKGKKSKKTKDSEVKGLEDRARIDIEEIDRCVPYLLGDAKLMEYLKCYSQLDCLLPSTAMTFAELFQERDELTRLFPMIWEALDCKEEKWETLFRVSSAATTMLGAIMKACRCRHYQYKCLVDEAVDKTLETLPQSLQSDQSKEIDDLFAKSQVIVRSILMKEGLYGELASVFYEMYQCLTQIEVKPVLINHYQNPFASHFVEESPDKEGIDLAIKQRILSLFFLYAFNPLLQQKNSGKVVIRMIKKFQGFVPELEEQWEKQQKERALDRVALLSSQVKTDVRSSTSILWKNVLFRLFETGQQGICEPQDSWRKKENDSTSTELVFSFN